MIWVTKMDEERKLPKRKDLRLKQYDYSSKGAYFVTICIKDRKRILSDIIKPVGVGAHDDPLRLQIRMTRIGEIVQKYLLSSENISGVKIDRYVIMPDHIHAIIFLYPDEYATRKNGSSRAPTPTSCLSFTCRGGYHPPAFLGATPSPCKYRKREVKSLLAFAFIQVYI